MTLILTMSHCPNGSKSSSNHGHLCMFKCWCTGDSGMLYKQHLVISVYILV